MELFSIRIQRTFQLVSTHQGEEYLAAQMDYTLGKILEKHID